MARGTGQLVPGARPALTITTPEQQHASRARSANLQLVNLRQHATHALQVTFQQWKVQPPHANLARLVNLQIPWVLLNARHARREGSRLRVVLLCATFAVKVGDQARVPLNAISVQPGSLLQPTVRRNVSFAL
mmetsp:Transcript_125007/g.220162  ORF Transcript_125007/g.220162 Transcript_125007/m.220162 type:complete len:133 (-) Transcript_125007:318-716(-)